jgi:hypothetical protein
MPNPQPGEAGTTLRLAPTLLPAWHRWPYQEVTAPASIALRVTGARRPPVHDKTAFLAEENYVLS